MGADKRRAENYINDAHATTEYKRLAVANSLLEAFVKRYGENAIFSQDFRLAINAALKMERGEEAVRRVTESIKAMPAQETTGMRSEGHPTPEELMDLTIEKLISFGYSDIASLLSSMGSGGKTGN